MTKKAATTINLEYPFEFDGTRYDRLTMRRPKAKDMRLMAGITKENEDTPEAMDASLKAAASMLGISMEVFDELDVSDMNKVMETFGDFLDTVPASDSGDKSAPKLPTS